MSEYGAPPQGGMPQGGQAPQSHQPAQPAPPKKKSRKGLIIGGCTGCFLILACCCGTGGYLAYLEEGVSYSAPGEEWKSYPITPGQPIAIQETWSGTGYADIRVYVDVGEGAPPGTTVEGIFDCSEYGDPTPQSVYLTNDRFSGSDVPEGWIHMSDIWLYVRDGGSFTCAGSLTIAPPAPNARLVLTERQRPSDWLGGL